jgi:hypothetical protein
MLELDIKDSQITHADLWRRSNAVSRFSGECHDPGTRIVDVDLGVTGVHSRESNAIPSSELNEVLDRRDSDLMRM